VKGNHFHYSQRMTSKRSKVYKNEARNMTPQPRRARMYAYNNNMDLNGKILRLLSVLSLFISVSRVPIWEFW